MNQHKTRGIVLHQIKYSETSVIAKIYTELFGLESFIIRGVRNNKSKVKQGLLRHLSLVDLVVYHNNKKGLQHLKEIKSNYTFKSIPFDMRKSSIALFMNEILYKSIKEETKNEEMFDFIYKSIISLDEAEENFSDYHFHFVVKLNKYLGFYPNNNFSDNVSVFNIREGMFQEFVTDEETCMDESLSNQFHLLLEKEFGEHYVPAEYRKQLLNKIIEYYRYHVAGISEIKSHQVLETVFN